MMRPIMVTSNAAILAKKGIVITGVLIGVKLDVKMSPAMMLPQARRLIGLEIKGLFSLIGERGSERG